MQTKVAETLPVVKKSRRFNVDTVALWSCMQRTSYTPRPAHKVGNKNIRQSPLGFWLFSCSPRGVAIKSSNHSGDGARTTHNMADRSVMKDSVESNTNKKERLSPLVTNSGKAPLNAAASLCGHWPEYLMEAGELALYMFAVCAFATLLQHPASPVRHFIADAVARRALMGLWVGSTVVAIILTPWGKQSGGHFNPAITLTFYRLRKVAFWDTLFYVAAQFAGAVGGVGMAGYVLRGAAENPAVRYAVTVPGVFGNAWAFVGEVTISAILMATILFASNREGLTPYTPYLVGALYAAFITLETPLSGMSMNPARTFASASGAGSWQALWIYFIAPTLGVLAGAEVFLWARRGVGPYCAKLHHDNDNRCIFHHGDRGASPRFFSKEISRCTNGNSPSPCPPSHGALLG